jgi:hypothetical protein
MSDRTYLRVLIAGLSLLLGAGIAHTWARYAQPERVIELFYVPADRPVVQPYWYEFPDMYPPPMPDDYMHQPYGSTPLRRCPRDTSPTDDNGVWL